MINRIQVKLNRGKILQDCIDNLLKRKSTGWNEINIMKYQWPVQRIGARAYMRSTYDRAGGNESADASHFLFMEEEAHNVTLKMHPQRKLF